MLYVSGQCPLDLATGTVGGGSIEDQTRMTLSHVGKILDAGGCSLEDVVKCTCHLADIEDFDCFNRVYEESFRGMRPAWTTIQSVLWGGLTVEIDAVARGTA